MRKNPLTFLQEASLEAGAAVQVKAFELVESRRKRTAGGLGLVLAGVLIAASPAVAQGCLRGSQKSAADTISKFFDGAAKFMMVIGGAAALLMFAVGGFMWIVASSPTEVQRAKGFIKNAIIGLIVLVAGLLINTVVVNLVEGISTGHNDADCVRQGSGRAR